MKFLLTLLISILLIYSIKSKSIEKYLSAISNLNKNYPSTSVAYSHPLQIHSQTNFSIGQISGLATSIKSPEQLFIFHRATRQWSFDSFPDNYHFNTKKFQAIEQNTILSVNIQTGELTDQWANNTFFMPHGLSIDHEENLWLTDVAMQQIFKYRNNKELMRIGQLFEPGNDQKHFCKPTDVIVSNDNEKSIYVSDGYCNSRVMKFDSNGSFIREYQMSKDEKPLFIPHSLTIISSLQLLCVADRQNGRIVCFDLNQVNEGNVKYIISHPKMNTVYAITTDEKNNVLYAVSGKDWLNSASGFTYSIHPDSFGHLLQTWQSTDDFGEPHDLTLSTDGKYLFVGTIHPNQIHVFNITYPNN